MAIDELLRANLETHWYAVNEFDELESVEKDSKFTRCWRRCFDLVTCSDSYAYIRYSQIMTALASAVRNEWDRETVGKYLQLIEKIKEKVGSTLPPNEVEKSIVARYNQLGCSQTPAVSIEWIESFVQQEMLQGTNLLHDLGNYIIFSHEDGWTFKISKEGSTLRVSDQALHAYVSALEKAKMVCKAQKLDRLFFPDAMVVKIYLAGKIRDLLIERTLDEEEVCNYRFFDDQERCDEIVRQLAVLTLNTGAHVAYWDLRPLKATRTGVVGVRDLKLGSVYSGLFGGKKTENDFNNGLEDLFNRGNAIRKRNRAIIFQEIERKLGISILGDHVVYTGTPGLPLQRYMEIANNLCQRIDIKKILDELPLDQPEKGTFYVDMERDVAVRGLDLISYPELQWNVSPPTNEELMQRVVEKLKRFGSITNVSDRDADGWTLQLFGAPVQENEMVKEEEAARQEGMKEIIYSAICDIFLSCLNKVNPVQELDF